MAHMFSGLLTLLFLLVISIPIIVIVVLFIIAGIYAYSKGKSRFWAVGKKASKRIKISLNYNRTFELILKTLNILAWSVRECDKNNSVIRASVPMSLKSWGEHIRINCSSESTKSSIIEVSSWSKWATTLIDWGKIKKT